MIAARHTRLTWILLLGAMLSAAACNQPKKDRSSRGTDSTRTSDGDLVELCDGKTKTKLGAAEPRNRTTALRVANDLMAQWKGRNPDREWAPDPDPAHAIVPGADNRELVSARAGPATQGTGHSYGNITEHDVTLRQREVQRAVAEGDRVFHDADALGSTIAVSCDMCHPNAANTHPETYPKFQVQLGRVALLRDMINWCLQHPVRAQPMAADDPRMRAMEAYIYAQRRGTSLNYGRR